MTPKRLKAAKKTDYERLIAQETLILDATETIIGLLEQRGMSRQELAARLGKSKGLVSHLLSGERNMTLRTLADLGYVLGCQFALNVSSAEDVPNAYWSGSGDVTPRDQEYRAETPVEVVDDWAHGNSADAHEYALAA